MTWKPKRWHSAALQALGVVVLYFAITLWQTRHALATGKPAPELSLRELDGRAFSLARMRGKPVLVHFWATWCGVCRLELPAIQSLAAHPPKDALVVSVVADGDDAGRVRAFAREHE